jgi:hypothetical protein
MNLLLLVSFIQGVSMDAVRRVQFDWKTAFTTRWAMGCRFLDGDIEVENSTAEGCGPLCVTYLQVHFIGCWFHGLAHLFLILFYFIF